MFRFESRSLRTIWLLFFAGFFGLAGAWAVAVPIGGTTDEVQHVIRAYGVVSGQILAEPNETWYRRAGADFTLPSSLALAQAVDCMYHTQPGSLEGDRKSAACINLSRDTTPVSQVGSWVGRYNPAFYALVGLPLLLKPSYAGIVGARLISAAICAALLAFAGTIAFAARQRFALLGILFAAPPTAVSLMGAVNPNGLEIASGILLWTAGLTASRTSLRTDERTLRRLILLVTLAGTILVTVRQTGPLIAAVILAILGIGTGWRTCLDLLKRRDSRAGALVLGLAVLASVGWGFLAHAYEMTGISTVEITGPGNAAFAIFNQRIESWLVSAVGMFGYSDTFVPLPIILVWCGGVLMLLVPVLIDGSRRSVIVVLAAFLSAVGLLAVLDVKYVASIGWSQTGRYVLAVSAGATIAAAFGSQIARTYGPRGTRRWLLLSLVIVASCHVYAVAMTMSRFQKGPSGGLNPFRGNWFPIAGPVLPILLITGGLALLARLATQSVLVAATQTAEVEHRILEKV